MRLIALALAVVPLQAAADLGINAYGLSYHFSRARAEKQGFANHFNAGLGLRYRMSQDGRMAWIADAGVYRDSGRNTAVVAGVGALWRVAGGWQAGAALAGFKSDSYNRGRAFVAPVPIAAYDFGRVTVNFVFTPRWSEVNEVATLAAWVTWWL